MFKRGANIIGNDGGGSSSGGGAVRALESSSAVSTASSSPGDPPVLDSGTSWYSSIMSPNSFWVLLGLGLGLAGGVIVYAGGRSRGKKAGKELQVFIRPLQLLPPPQPAPPAASHPLEGLTFAISDIFDVADFVTGFGCLDWERTHGPASSTATAVSALVQAGATCNGKTHMDEMGYGRMGVNKHYGTLVNPAAAAHVPGGSSSGSAVAVAGGAVDFSLGTDSGGGVSIPAAYCAVLGFRPSHGAISCNGVVPVSQSLDTVGWFARDPSILRKVGHVLLKQSDVKHPKCIFIADDCFNLVPLTELRNRQLAVAIGTIEKEYGIPVTRIKLGEYFASKIPTLKMSLVCFRVDGENGKAERGLAALAAVKDAFQLLQRHEFKMNHEEWIHELGLGVSEHLKDLKADSDHVSDAMKLRNEARIAINELLMNNGLLVIPTASCPPPKLLTEDHTKADFHDQTSTLLSLSRMSGCCQVSIPMAQYDGCPTAISLLARHGADGFLLEATKTLFQGLQKEPDSFTNGMHTGPMSFANGVHQDDPKAAAGAAEAAKEKGNAAFKKKDFRLAVRHYSDAIRFDEENATYYSNRAAAYLAMYNYHQAEADCSKAIELDKKNVKAFLRRATAREYLGFYRDADDDFREALLFEPTNKTAADGARRMKKLIFE